MEWRSLTEETERHLPTRRQFMIGAGVGGGLLLGFALWPRRYLPNLAAAAGETLFNAFLLIGTDGHIVFVSPQIELGQGSSTLLAQIVADELGADWRTIGVEGAPLNPLYANAAFTDWAGWRSAFALTSPAPLQVTEEALTISAYETPLREAAAGARSILCQAAAKRWSVDASSCDTASGFVFCGKQRVRFGDLVSEAVRLTPPDPLPMRGGGNNRLIGLSLPRLDAPAKIDGSAQYAADIRLPEMVFACIRQGPLGETKLHHFDEAAARKVAGAVEVIALPDGLACVGATSWVAAQMLDAAAPSFETRGALVDDAAVIKALDAALAAEGTRVLALGDADHELSVGAPTSATYHIGLLPHLALEPLSATARYAKGVLEIWASAQMPAQARDAAAQAAGLSKNNVIIHPVTGGGSFGRRYELDAVRQVAQLAVKLNPPVQLFWTRGEDLMHDRFGGGMAATLRAHVLSDGQIMAWQAAIAAPAYMTELKARTMGGKSADAAMKASANAQDTALINTTQPPYPIANLGIDMHPAQLNVPTGPMRGGPALATCFINECFINELASKSGVEPLSFRMALVSGNPRLAACLVKAGQIGNWTGGSPDSPQGLALYATDTSYIAVVAEAKIGDNGRVVVSKITAIADVGTVINPDITRQHIEGGLLFGIAQALAAPMQIKNGLAGPLRMGAFGLPRLNETPDITVELMPSNAPAADAWGIAVPPIAPAIVGSIFAASGKRIRTLPFSLGTPA